MVRRAVDCGHHGVYEGPGVLITGSQTASIPRNAAGFTNPERPSRLLVRCSQMLQPHVDFGSAHHVREQAEGSRDEVDAEPCFKHAADRGGR